MELMLFVYALAAIVVALGAGLVYLYIKRNFFDQQVKIAQEIAKKVLEDAKKDAETKRKESLIDIKEEALKMRNEFEKESRERKSELTNIERRLNQKEDENDKKQKFIEEVQKRIKDREEQLDQIKAKLEEIHQAQIKELEKVAGMNRDEAKTLLLKNLEGELDKEAGQLIRIKEEQVRKEADKKAKEIITTAIQRCAVDHTVETTVTVVELPSDDMKGRVIGREGRNIRAFENLTGVDLVVDDTPGAVLLSGFDPLRRETARMTLTKLIVDGRIHPARVEEMYEKSKAELKQKMWEYGEQATVDTDVHNMPPVLIQLLGRLKYRTSYGQNVLQHSIEVAHLAGMLAAELGVNIKLAKRAGLLHDIGKAIDQEVEGTHPKLGMMFAQKAGETPEVVHAIAAHHGDEEPQTIEAVLVLVADAISAARPGARRDSLEAYIKRLQKLETVASGFPGVEKSYAIQAGREIRVVVQPDKINDDQAAKLAHDIARKIESELEYPGEVRVTVIRETRTQDVAK